MQGSCKHCGAPLKPVPGKNYWTCEYCLAFWFPHARKDGIVPGNRFSGHDCPVCRHVLTLSTIEGHEAFWCEKCHGILMKRGTFTRVVEVRRSLNRAGYCDYKPTPLDTTSRRLICPGCHQPMETHPYYGPGQVVIDSCGDCHLIWLDPGELTQIETSR